MDNEKCNSSKSFKAHLYNKTRHWYTYMLPIAGQTAGPIGLNFFVSTQGWPGVLWLKKNFKNVRHFFQIFLFHGQRRALQPVIIITIYSK